MNAHEPIASKPKPATASGNINMTESCTCGRSKEQNFQWCVACWSQLTTILQTAYISKMFSAKVTIKDCQTHLK